MLRRALRLLLVSFVILGLVPGSVEIVENVEHLVHDGHVAHSDAHEAAVSAGHETGHDLGDEHGCTPLQHQCGCHSSVPGDLPPSKLLSLPVAAPEPPHAMPDYARRAPWRTVDPHRRPPIA